jgi:DNA-directed RNA polymerase specialized sigma24 family protein
MEREAALDRMPPTHAIALRAREQGMSREDLATLLGIELEAVGPLIEVATEKLRALEAERLGGAAP